MDLFALNGMTIGKIGTEVSAIKIHLDGKYIYGTLHGSRILESSSRKAFTEKTLPVIAVAATDMCRHGPNMYVWYSEKDNGTMSDVINYLKNTKNNVQVTELLMPPDESQESSPREVKASVPQLTEYREALSEFSESVENCRSMSDSLTRINIPKGMWGARKISSYLSSVQSDLQDMSKDFESFDVAIERSDRDVGATLCSRDVSLANRIASSFRQIKEVMSRTAQVMHRVYDADRIFKKESGYPATWFFPSSLFYDFNYNYENLVRDLVKTAYIENDTILPLIARRVQQSTGAS